MGFGKNQTLELRGDVTLDLVPYRGGLLAMLVGWFEPQYFGIDLAADGDGEAVQAVDILGAASSKIALNRLCKKARVQVLPDLG